MDKWIDGWMEGWMDTCTRECMDSSVDECIWMDAWNLYMNFWMDKHIAGQQHFPELWDISFLGICIMLIYLPDQWSFSSFYVLSLGPHCIFYLKKTHWAYLIQVEPQGLCSQYLQMTKSQIYFNLSLTWNLMSFYWHSKENVNIFLVSALWVPAEPLGPRSTSPTAHFSDEEMKVCRENVASTRSCMKWD